MTTMTVKKKTGIRCACTVDESIFWMDFDASFVLWYQRVQYNSRAIMMQNLSLSRDGLGRKNAAIVSLQRALKNICEVSARLCFFHKLTGWCCSELIYNTAEHCAIAFV